MAQPHLPPLQFTYQPTLGVDETIIYLLNQAYAHLEKLASHVSVMIFQFSNAFDKLG